MLFYITVLVNLALLGIAPPTGWLQDIQPWESKEQCESMLLEKLPPMALNIRQWTGGMGEIITWECMTEKDWLKRNNELGHKTPTEFEPKEPNSLN
jgi:hypothetical protein